jgi:hypothetical protein
LVHVNGTPGNIKFKNGNHREKKEWDNLKDGWMDGDGV